MGKYSHVTVWLKSVLSPHKFQAIRLRNIDRMEVTKFDPYLQRKVLYKEMKKITNFKP
ncbi:unnamed protein product [Larinioides sclopetarius]